MSLKVFVVSPALFSVAAASRVLGLVLLAAVGVQAAPCPEPVHGDFILRDFRFASGGVLPELNMHYFTFGTPTRNAEGRVADAVLLLQRHEPARSAEAQS